MCVRPSRGATPERARGQTGVRAPCCSDEALEVGVLQLVGRQSSGAGSSSDSSISSARARSAVVRVCTSRRRSTA
eukprot:2113723-Prymnesium_polylepis.1